MADEHQLDIDGMIAALEGKIVALQDAVGALRKAKAALGGVGFASGAGTTRGPNDVAPDQFTGRSILDAAEAYLRFVGRPARPTDEIVQALQRGGVQRVAPGSVSTILFRGHNADAPVVRVQKGMWGLVDWYPKRPAKLGRRKANGSGAADVEPNENGSEDLLPPPED